MNRCALLSKFIALSYGLICLAVAFLSHLLGGILQASLSIFGMVGGPLLAIFTLGMFCPCANQPVSSTYYMFHPLIAKVLVN